MTCSGKILRGNCFEVLDTLPSNHYHCCITSPPYWKKRIYPCEPCNFNGWIGVLGDEPTIEQFVKNLVLICEKVKRVLRNDGVFWLNLGDSYAQEGKRNSENEQNKNKERAKDKNYPTGAYSGSPGWERAVGTVGGSVRRKSLVLVPERVAIALQEAGWIIRSRCIWFKRNSLSESATDRPSPDFEHVWMLTKSENYFYNREAVKKQPKTDDPEEYCGYLKTTWDITTQPSASQHTSSFPDKIAEWPILLSTADYCCVECGLPYIADIEIGTPNLEAQRRMGGRKEDGSYEGQEQKKYKTLGAQEPSKTKSRILKSLTNKSVTGWFSICICSVCGQKPAPCRVIDIFSGSGTTGFNAIKNNRSYTGIELDPISADVSEFQIQCALEGLSRLETNRLIKEVWPRNVN